MTNGPGLEPPCGWGAGELRVSLARGAADRCCEGFGSPGPRVPVSAAAVVDSEVLGCRASQVISRGFHKLVFSPVIFLQSFYD